MKINNHVHETYDINSSSEPMRPRGADSHKIKHKNIRGTRPSVVNEKRLAYLRRYVDIRGQFDLTRAVTTALSQLQLPSEAMHFKRADYGSSCVPPRYLRSILNKIYVPSASNRDHALLRMNDDIEEFYQERKLASNHLEVDINNIGVYGSTKPGNLRHIALDISGPAVEELRNDQQELLSTIDPHNKCNIDSSVPHHISLVAVRSHYEAGIVKNAFREQGLGGIALNLMPLSLRSTNVHNP